MEIKEKLKTILFSMPVNDIKNFIRGYNELAETKMKGFSKLNKFELVDFIVNQLTDDEIVTYHNNLGENVIKLIIKESRLLLDKKHKIERIEKINEYDNGYIFHFKGFSWDTETSLHKEENNYIYKCNCIIGKNDGICKHIMSIIIYMYDKNKVNLSMLPFDIKEEWVKK